MAPTSTSATRSCTTSQASTRATSPLRGSSPYADVRIGRPMKVKGPGRDLGAIFGVVTVAGGCRRGADRLLWLRFRLDGVSQAGFDGGLETRISVLERGTSV